MTTRIQNTGSDSSQSLPSISEDHSSKGELKVRSGSTSSSTSSLGETTNYLQPPTEKSYQIENLSSEASKKLYQETLKKTQEAWENFQELMITYPLTNPKDQIKSQAIFQSLFEQAHVLLTLQGVNHDSRTKNIDFFSGLININNLPTSDLSSISSDSRQKFNEILNGFFVLDTLKEADFMSSKNKQILKRMLPDDFESYKKDWERVKKNPVLRTKLIIRVLYAYKLRIEQLENGSNTKNVEIFQNLQKKIKGTQIFLTLYDLSRLLDACYLNTKVNAEIQRSIKQLIKNSKKNLTAAKIGESVPLEYSRLVDQIKDQLEQTNPSQPIEEWRRAIAGGYISVVDGKGDYLIEPCSPKESDEAASTFNTRLDQWAEQITDVISEGMFGNKNLLTASFEAIKKELNESFPGDPPLVGTGLSTHERIFQKLKSHAKDQIIMGKIVKSVQDVIDEKKIEEIHATQVLTHINEFYRVTMQGLSLGAVQTLKTLFLHCFEEQRLPLEFQSPTSVSGKEINHIRIQFEKGAAVLNVLKKGFLREPSDELISIDNQFLQQVKILIPKPGFRSPADPVTIEYFYYLSDETSTSTLKFLDQFKLLASASGFPEIKKLKEPI
ncbi:MAG: hypothetical protein JJU12_06760 [Chlamydiales bacterium]|nr:hypothetical protein [Chlamydiales bacterium]